MVVSTSTLNPLPDCGAVVVVAAVVGGEEPPGLEQRAAVKDAKGLGMFAVKALVCACEDVDASERHVLTAHYIETDVDPRVNNNIIISGQAINAVKLR